MPAPARPRSLPSSPWAVRLSTSNGRSQTRSTSSSRPSTRVSSRRPRCSTDRTGRWSWGNPILQASSMGISRTASTRSNTSRLLRRSRLTGTSFLPICLLQQAYGDFYQPGQYDTRTTCHDSYFNFFSTDTFLELWATLFRLDFTYMQPTSSGTGVSWSSMAPNEITVSWLA